MVFGWGGEGGEKTMGSKSFLFRPTIWEKMKKFQILPKQYSKLSYRGWGLWQFPCVGPTPHVRAQRTALRLPKDCQRKQFFPPIEEKSGGRVGLMENYPFALPHLNVAFVFPFRYVTFLCFGLLFFSLTFSFIFSYILQHFFLGTRGIGVNFYNQHFLFSFFSFLFHPKKISGEKTKISSILQLFHLHLNPSTFSFPNQTNSK